MFSVYRFVQLPISEIASDESRRIIKYLDASLRAAQAKMLVVSRACARALRTPMMSQERVKRRQAEAQLQSVRKQLRTAQQSAMVVAVSKSSSIGAASSSKSVKAASTSTPPAMNPPTPAPSAIAVVQPTTSAPQLQSRSIAPPPPLAPPPVLDVPLVSGALRDL
jgi:hypothetical protein